MAQWEKRPPGHDHRVEVADDTRVTELYLKAVDQFGSDEPAVRLGGVHALDRLGREHPEHRQVIVNLWCSYLRMTNPQPTNPGPNDAPEPPRETTVSSEEQHVQTTIAELLTARLRDPRPHAERNPRITPPPVTPTFWGPLDIDLSNTRLPAVDLSDCWIATATFTNTTFTTDARFRGTVFTDDAGFGGAVFTGYAGFGGAIFTDGVWFGGAVFTGYAGFDGAVFTGGASFAEAVFIGRAGFVEAVFTGGAWFGSAVFTDDAAFGGTVVTGRTWFNAAVFTGHAWFVGATFTGRADFSGAVFTGGAGFIGAVFTGGAGFGGAMFTGRAAGFGEAIFTDDAGFDTAVFTDNASTDGLMLLWQDPETETAAAEDAVGG
ncbi:pentapeptide repeat-containing protein [Phytomonospora sp. NPDC050363]|uniref:pentapeptide repeat-containing protein n=1 Tax=Phytomonospora sp. NPDC050363 TaxID=3155642 RepID=UPI0033EDF760